MSTTALQTGLTCNFRPGRLIVAVSAPVVGEEQDQPIFEQRFPSQRVDDPTNGIVHVLRTGGVLTTLGWNVGRAVKPRLRFIKGPRLF